MKNSFFEKCHLSTFATMGFKLTNSGTAVSWCRVQRKLMVSSSDGALVNKLFTKNVNCQHIEQVSTFELTVASKLFLTPKISQSKIRDKSLHARLETETSLKTAI